MRLRLILWLMEGYYDRHGYPSELDGCLDAIFGLRRRGETETV